MCSPSSVLTPGFIMSPNSIMGEELKFQQRLEFRGKENDSNSSSGDSKSSSIGEPVFKRYKLVSDLSSLDDDETNNTSRLQQNCNSNTGDRDQIEFAKAKEKKLRRGKKNNFTDSEMKRDCYEEVNRKKSKTIVYDPAAINDVKNFSGSLLEDLKVTRENLFTWMREEMNKLVADDTAPTKGRRKRASRGKKVRLQHHNNFEKNVQFLQQNNTEENIQVQHLNNNGAIVHLQEQSNFEDTEVQHQNNFKSGMRVQNCSGGSPETVTNSIKSVDTNDYNQTIDDHVDYGQAGGPKSSTEEGKRESSALTLNSNFQSGPSNQEVQVQLPKSVVLAVRAQNCNDGSSGRSVKRKETAYLNKRNQVLEDRVGYSQVTGSVTSTEGDKAERLQLSVEQSFSLDPSGQVAAVASSMYFTLPTVLTKPYQSNNWERAKQMHDSGTHIGCIPNMQPEERSANFAQMGSRHTSCFDQNGIQTSSSSTGFPVPLDQGMNSSSKLPSQFLLGNLAQESGNTLGLLMNEGAITFSGGSYALSENFDANNLLRHSNYKAEGTFMPYQIPSIKDVYLFPN